MNQDFTVKKKSNICLKKKSYRGVHLKKNFLHKERAKTKIKFVQAENSPTPPPPPPPITFLMLRPLEKTVYSTTHKTILNRPMDHTGKT